MRKKKPSPQYVTLPGEGVVCRVAEQGEVRYSTFQGRQSKNWVMEMLMNDPELLDKMPGVTPEQRECYEANRQMKEWWCEHDRSGGSGGRGGVHRDVHGVRDRRTQAAAQVPRGYAPVHPAAKGGTERCR